jgi:hypothetical protein
LTDTLVKGLTMTSSTLKTTTTLLTLALGSAIAFAGSANIPAVDDAMIFGTSAGSDTGNASGKGPAMFAGADGGSNRKRSLVTFDLGGSIPGGVTIDVVRMDLVLGIIAGSGMGGDGSNLPSRTIRVYHLTTAWNEGSSGSPTSPTIGGTGGGYTISTGDTSWHYTSYNGSTWTNLGGDFNSTEIASATFTSPFTVGQTCSWSSSGMVSDVQGWVSSSSSYHGWLIKSDLETTATSFLGWWTVDGATANSNMSLQPILHVEWH